ncbi:MAG: HesA/MoeB/ThiF family protein [Bacteroidales bacterium]|nr:HesA/MoeB/ThiF family protein [Bacteroidales bacterium]
MNSQPSTLSQKEIRRYALQISVPQIGIKGQEKIKSAKVLVIGAGGKGTSVMQNLASIGVGEMGISDNFPVLESDLSRQHLYGSNDIGKQKAIISRQKLLEINNLNNYRLHNVFLSADNISTICRDYDVLVDTTDNAAAHYLISDAAVELNKPLVFGALKGGNGLVTILNYQHGPSLRCIFPEPEMMERTNSDEDFTCHLSLLAIVGGIITNEVVKVILKRDSQLSSNLLNIDLGKYIFSLKPVERNPDNFKANN